VQSLEHDGIYESRTPLTTYSGSEYEPALSPDGNQVTFSWNGENKP
jgi:Tol biopolymer transport system component